MVRLIPTNAAPRVHNDCASYRNEYYSVPDEEEVDLIASYSFFSKFLALTDDYSIMRNSLRRTRVETVSTGFQNY